MRIVIVGDDEPNRRMSAVLFARLCMLTADHITTKWRAPWHQIMLVSGGDAWGDHVAVHLAAQYGAALQLVLPGNTYECSAIAYHNIVQAATGMASFAQLQSAVDAGASIVTIDNYFDRVWTMAAHCDCLLVLTWGADMHGRIADVWNACPLSAPYRHHINMLQWAAI